MSFCSNLGSEKESAAAWLAAATKQRSPQTTRRKNGMHLHFGGGGGGDDGDVTGLKFTSTGSTGISCGTEVQLAEKQSAAFPFPPVPTFSINKSSQYTPSFQSSSSLSSSSSPAPASRAIPTIVTTPPTTTTTNTFFSGIDSSTAQYQIPSNNNSSASVQTPQPQPPVSPKPLQPFGKNDRVRRTSILRPPASFVPSPAASVAAAKKKVSFADTAGKALEVVRYFSITPVATRRYSSYTAPTGDAYLTNGNYNSPWNFAISGNTNRGSSIRTSTGNGCSSAASTAAPAFSVSKEYDYSQHGKLAPRYELVACNFTSPSLQISFGQKLEAQSVLLHSVTTAETTVYGTVSVMNRHFTKRVLVRYTFNEWASYIEREATYMLGSHDGRTDKFSFVIYARPEDFRARAGSGIGGNQQQQQQPNLATAFTAYSQANTFVANGSQSATSSHPRLYFALCFSTGDGRQYWDNNDGRNYCLNLTAY